MKMENINIRWITLCFISIFMISCSQDNDDLDITGDGQDETTAYINLDTRALPANTICDMYIFWKQTGSADDYVLKEKKVITSSPTTIKFLNKDLANMSYRFLFVTVEGNNPEMAVLDKTSGAWNESMEWSNLIMRAQKRDLSANNFYGIVDKTGNQIMDDGTIHASLIRMVGQMVTDIFKINGTIDNPTNIIADGSVTSVLDRVYKIDIEYSSMTQDITFDASNNIIRDGEWSGNYTQSITVNMNNTSFRVPVDGTVPELEKVAVNPTGSVRIKGLYLFPADKKVKCKLTFYYYDTMPACGNSSHQHDITCYEPKTLVLNLPQESNPEGLSVFANYFTLTKGGIRYDRIIDLSAQGNYQFVTKWANEVL